MSTKQNQFRDLIQASGQAPVAQPNTSPSAPVGRERVPGKRESPDYVQVGVYLPKKLHKAAKVILIHEDRDFSDLMGDLLAAYLAKR